MYADLALEHHALKDVQIDESMAGVSIDGFLNLWQARQLLAKMHLFVAGHRNLLANVI